MKTRRLALILLAVSATGAVALAAVAAAFYFGRDLVAPNAADASPQPSAVDARGTCVLLIPAGRQVTDHVLAIAEHPDGSKTDWDGVQQSIADLEMIKSISAPDFHADIDAQIKPMRQLLAIRAGSPDTEISFEEMRTAGMHIAARCMEYAD